MRSPTSHKGDNGSVAVIGGSRTQHGAPLFAALAAEASGADLVFPFVPVEHAEVAKHASLNFQVRTFGTARSDTVRAEDHTMLMESLATIDVAVIGPGLARTPSALQHIFRLLEEVPCPLVVDASALQARTLDLVARRGAVLTPHLGELERMGLLLEDIPAVCRQHRCTIVLKGREDIITDEHGTQRVVRGGNPGLTVGGTGDVLAGLIGGLRAQGMDAADACVLASTCVKRAGDVLCQTVGYSYTATDVLREIPSLLRFLAFPS